jgi:sulfur relay protein TusB/DsrH
MRVLHLIRRPNDRLAFEAAGRQGREATVLLIQDGVRAVIQGVGPGAAGTIYVSADDVQARGVETDYPGLTAVQMSELIVSHERVLVW